jgi:hypothetical protein
MLFVEQSLTSLEQCNLANLGLYHPGPARLTAPPVTPKEEIGTGYVVPAVGGVSNGGWFGVIPRVASFAPVVSLTGFAAKQHSLA